MLLHAEKLTWDHCTDLSSVMDEGDTREIGYLGHTPRTALSGALLEGHSTAACLDDGEIVGAFGWSGVGSIWSLWKPLSKGLQLEVLKRTPEWTKKLVDESGQPYLANYVAMDNTKAIRWLKASRCFAIEPYIQHLFGKPHHYFQTTVTPDV